MNKIYYLIVMTVFFLNGSSMVAQSVWDGPELTFTKAGNVDWTLEANQDRITDNVWLTRQNSRPMYNFKWWQDTFGLDPFATDIANDFLGSPNPLLFTPTGGTKGVKWTLLDDTGSTSDGSGYNFGVLVFQSTFTVLTTSFKSLKSWNFRKGILVQ